MLQRHLQETYEYLFDTAHEALKGGASFAPFGAGIRKTGEQIHTNVDLAIEKSSPQDHISGLIAGFRLDEEQNGLIAAGLVFDGHARSDDAAYTSPAPVVSTAVTEGAGTCSTRPAVQRRAPRAPSVTITAWASIEPNAAASTAFTTAMSTMSNRPP